MKYFSLTLAVLSLMLLEVFLISMVLSALENQTVVGLLQVFLAMSTTTDNG